MVQIFFSAIRATRRGSRAKYASRSKSYFVRKYSAPFPAYLFADRNTRRQKEKKTLLDPITLLLGTTGGTVALGLLWDSFFVVRQKTSVVIERLGKLDSVRRAGLQFKLPIIDRVVTSQNLRIQQLDVDVETKTLDNVFVNTKVSVQYYIV